MLKLSNTHYPNALLLPFFFVTGSSPFWLISSCLYGSHLQGIVFTDLTARHLYSVFGALGLFGWCDTLPPLRWVADKNPPYLPHWISTISPNINPPPGGLVGLLFQQEGFTRLTRSTSSGELPSFFWEFSTKCEVPPHISSPYFKVLEISVQIESQDCTFIFRRGHSFEWPVIRPPLGCPRATPTSSAFSSDASRPWAPAESPTHSHPRTNAAFSPYTKPAVFVTGDAFCL